MNETVYGIDFGGYRSVISSINNKLKFNLLENEFGEKYVTYYQFYFSQGILFLGGKLGKYIIGSKALDPVYYYILIL